MDFNKITEQHSLYDNLENKSVSEILREINNEDKKVALAVEKEIPQIERLVERIVERMSNGGRLFYIGAGTSGRLGVLDASEIPPTFGLDAGRVIGLIAGGDTALRKAVEHAEDDPAQAWVDLSTHNICQNDVVVGIAASGTTPYVVGGIESCRKHGIFTGAITSNPGSPLSKAADIAVVPVVGPEYITGSSRMKSGSAQKMVLNMITTSTMIRLGRVKGNKMINMALTNTKLIDRGTRMIMEELGISFDDARQLLLTHGSVKSVLNLFN